MTQSGSTRPERIPNTLAGLQELNSKALQALQQQLQAHLSAAHQELRAQVMPLLAGWLGIGCGGKGSGRCLERLVLSLGAKAFCRTSSNEHPT